MRASVTTVAQLMGLSDAELLALPNFGKSSLARVRKALGSHRTQLVEWPPESVKKAAEALEQSAIYEEPAVSADCDHERVVEWARERQGTNMTWQEIKQEGDLLGVDLVIAPKGIHKPKGAQVVRAVRSNPESAYAATDERGVGVWWYSLERPGSGLEKKSPPSKYAVRLVWVTGFDFSTGRCRLSGSPAENPPTHLAPPDDPLLKHPGLYTNRGLWQNYVLQTPLVYFEGF